MKRYSGLNIMDIYDPRLLYFPTRKLTRRWYTHTRSFPIGGRLSHQPIKSKGFGPHHVCPLSNLGWGANYAILTQASHVPIHIYSSHNAPVQGAGFPGCDVSVSRKEELLQEFCAGIKCRVTPRRNSLLRESSVKNRHEYAPVFAWSHAADPSCRLLSAGSGSCQLL